MIALLLMSNKNRQFRDLVTLKAELFDVASISCIIIKYVSRIEAASKRIISIFF